MENINPDCPCKEDCKLHGKCIECQKKHHAKGSLTACGK